MTNSPIADYFDGDEMYFIVQRSILQSMPTTWQIQFRGLVEYLNARVPDDAPDGFMVFPVDAKGNDVEDRYAENPDGRRQVTLKTVTKKGAV